MKAKLASRIPGLVAGGVLLLILGYVTRPVLVVDAKTKLPVGGAHVSYRSYGWNGCTPKGATETRLGLAILGPMLNPCQVEVEREGYHVNGANDVSRLSGIGPFRMVELQRLSAPQEPIVCVLPFTSDSPSVDLLSLIRAARDGEAAGGTAKESGVYDFTFTVIDNEEKARNVIGDFILEVEFFAKGGIKEVSSDESPGRDASARYYDLQNVLTAPTSGYEQRLAIRVGRPYVARLRDGAHHVKLHVFATKKLDGANYVCVTAYAQASPGTHLEFRRIRENVTCFIGQGPRCIRR